MSIRRYQSAQSLAETPQEIELRVFGAVTGGLEAAGEDVAKRSDALYRNLKLWSMLQTDLASPGNALPDPLKQSLLALARFAQRYSYQAMGTEAPLVPLIAINRQMMEALSAQLTARRTGTAEPPGTAQ